jgi:gas vesicle protein
MTEPKDKLLQAFNHMIDELHATIEKAEEKIAPTLDEMITNAEKMSKQLYALTQDEIRLVSEHVKRDIAHAKEYMQSEGHELNQWLKFDIKQVEDKFADFLAQAADKNWLDFHAFKSGQKNTLYRTGEICGPGTLRCLNCEQEMKITKNNRIPPCPKCHKTEFEREVE